MSAPATRTCTKCGETKPLDQFTPPRHQCKACIAKNQAVYRAANVERNREHKRRHYERNREAILRRVAQWAQDNPERTRERRRAHYARHVDRHREFYRNRELAKRADFDANSEAWVEIVAADPCAYCGGAATEIDHIVPIKRGGTGAWDNLTSSCRSCNAKKNAQPLLTFLLRS